MQDEERDPDEDSLARDVPSSPNLRLSDEQIDCAFDYFLLFDRATNKMDLPLDDPETMARLIHERQSDLELAAHIGKTLLDRNRELDQQLKERERQMASANETINQLQHTLGIKEELLHMWTQNLDAHENSPCPSTEFDVCQRTTRDHPTDTSMGASGSFRREEIDFIHKKIQALEEENLNLRNERTGEQGAALRECMRKLADAVVYIRNLSDEQSKRSDALLQQQHQLNLLMRRSQELENNLNQHCCNQEWVGITNEMLAGKVDELKTINQHLHNELRDMKDKYDESLALYAQAQASVRQLRRRTQRANLSHTSLLCSPPNLRTDLCAPMAVRPMSIAEELVQSVQQQQQPPAATFLKTPLTATDAGSGDERMPAACADMESGSNLGPSAIQREVDCMWDDATIASSGFVSFSEPLENAVTSTRQPTSPRRRRAEVLQDSRRIALSRGLAWEENLGEIEDYVFEEDDDSAGPIEVGESPVNFGPSSPETTAYDLAQQLQNLQLNANSAFRIQQPLQRDAPPPSTSQPFQSGVHCTFRRSLILEPGALDTLTEDLKEPRSETCDTGRRKSLDDSSIDSRAPTVCSMSYIAPQRLQLIKQFEGSGILHRWQKLATPSITSALFESPLTGVLSRASSSAAGASAQAQNTDNFNINITPHPPSQSVLPARHTRARSCEIPNTEGGDSASTLPPSFSLSFGRGTPPVNMDILPGTFTPMLSTVLAAGIGPTVRPAPQSPDFSTESLLSQYLSSQRGRQFRPPAGNYAPDTSAAVVSNVVAGPEEGITSTRSLSPVCRGLLDVSELAMGGANGDPIDVAAPMLRPASPVATTNPVTAGRPRRSNLAIGPTLNSVQEEAGFSLG
ncbi:hypothetical protein AAHC03_05225 [Spirometra sp. Aus1]